MLRAVSFFLFLDRELSVSLARPLSDKKPQAMANPTYFQRPLFSNFHPQTGYGYNRNMYGFDSMGYTQVKCSIFVLILHDYTCKIYNSFGLYFCCILQAFIIIFITFHVNFLIRFFSLLSMVDVISNILFSKFFNMVFHLVIYGRGLTPEGMTMVPMILPDGHVGYVL